MSENIRVQAKQDAIKNARVSVRETHSTLQGIQAELKTLVSGGDGEEGGGDLPLDDETRSALIRQMDDHLDFLDQKVEILNQKVNAYSELDEVLGFRALRNKIKGTKRNLKIASSDFQISNENLTFATHAVERAQVELNQEGYDVFVIKTNETIDYEQQVLEELITARAGEAAIAQQEAVIVDFQERLVAAEEAHDVLNENLSTQMLTLESAQSAVDVEQGQFEFLFNKLDNELLEFCEISDPRYLVSELDDDTPVLLLPVRVETRYMTVKHVRRGSDEIVEEGIGHVEEEREGAAPEEELVEERGRARRVEEEVREPIEEEHAPVEEGEGISIPDRKELWVRIFPDDLAVNSHEERLTPDEELGGQSYWNAFWNPIIELGSTINHKLGAWRALNGAYGPQRAAWIAKQTTPTNLGDDHTLFSPTFPVLILKPSAWTEAPKSYVLPDRFVVRLYSDATNYREVVGKMIPDPLTLGIAPNNDPDYDFEQLEGSIDFPDEIKWLSDFKEAENIGMGLSIPLLGTEDEHIERILVLGLKLTADKAEATSLFEDLIENHHYTSGGFSLIPQGTPTNNTEGSKSGYNKIDTDAEITFETEVEDNLFNISGDILEKSDGQWFANMLGINPDIMQHVFNANGTDVCEALAMNRALWPATMGYYLKQMMHPHVNSTDRTATRNFFNEFVTGRGKIPTFRVDDQPYGIITGTAFSRWNYIGDTGSNAGYLNGLNNNMLNPMYHIWDSFVSDYVKHVDINNPSANPSDEFINILGLHASSVEFHQRFANGTHKMWNIWRFLTESETSIPADFPELNGTSITNFLLAYNSHLTMTMVQPPKIFELNFLEKQRLLNGPVIDGFKSLVYSEIRGIQPFPDTAWNYIDWLLDDSTTITRIREELFDNLAGIEGDQKPPQALLYLLLRHAYLLEYLDTSTNILINNDVVSSEAELEVELQQMEGPGVVTAEEQALIYNAVVESYTIQTKADIAIQVQEEFEGEEVARHVIRTREEDLFVEEGPTLVDLINEEYDTRVDSFIADQQKWNYLMEPVEEVSGELSMEAHINNLLLDGDPATAFLAQQKDSLEKIKGLPTARLERSFAEHLDLCNYRLDSWLIGLVNQRLESQQNASEGMYLGAFGVLENLKPNTAFPGVYVVEVDESGVELPTGPEITDDFTYIGDTSATLERDPDSGKVRAVPTIDANNHGFVHTPSINHAVSAAILRAGYISHLAADSDDNTFAVNLTSERVRKALYYLEGIQNGQTLPALLGYRFERELHDRSTNFGIDPLTNNLDQYILDIRLAYPLVAGGVSTTEPGSIESQEARNVVDGLELINAYDEDNTILDPIVVDAGHRADIIVALDVIRNDMDAIADLLLSESVFQMARGNAERSGAVLKALSEGGFVQEPEIIHTPRTGAALTHRFAIQFDATQTQHNFWTLDGTPRSFAEPALNGWIGNQLPPAGKIKFNIEYDTFAGEITTTSPSTIVLTELNIEPIDLIYLVGDQGTNEDAAELSSRLAYIIYKTLAVTDDAVVRILYTDDTGMDLDEFNLFKIMPLLSELKRLIGNSRPIEVNDYLLAAESQAGASPDLLFTSLDVSGAKNRIRKTAGIDPGFTENLTALIDDLDTAITNAGEPTDPMPIDPTVTLNVLRSEIIKGATFGISHTFPAKLFDDSELERNKLVVLGKRARGILNARLTKVAALMIEVAPLTEAKEINIKLSEAGQTLFGRSFKIFPEFELLNANQVNLSRSNTNLLDVIGDMAAEEWMQTVAKVRNKITNYQKVRLLSDSLTGINAPDLTVTQLPVVSTTDDRWVGIELPENHVVSGDTLSLVIELPENNNAAALQAGMVIDEWVETIPDKNVETGVAMHYNQPNAEAPNTLIMAVTPQQTGSWEWDDLMDTINETLSLAKKRAVEPDHLKESVWGQVLPALVASVSSNDSTPSVDFGRNIVNVNQGQFGHVFPAEYAAPDDVE